MEERKERGGKEGRKSLRKEQIKRTQEKGIMVLREERKRRAER